MARPTPVLRANYLVRAVAVPVGRHEVVFSYDPPGYATGRTVSSVAWGRTRRGSGGQTVLLGRRRRHP